MPPATATLPGEQSPGWGTLAALCSLQNPRDSSGNRVKAAENPTESPGSGPVWQRGGLMGFPGEGCFSELLCKLLASRISSCSQLLRGYSGIFCPDGYLRALPLTQPSTPSARDWLVPRREEQKMPSQAKVVLLRRETLLFPPQILLAFCCFH